MTQISAASGLTPRLARPLAGSAPARSAHPAGVAATLAGPIVPTMLRLGLPTLVVLVVQTLVGVTETYFVGFLGTDALAGVALVFPVLMLMQMMANGGVGGGVAAAVARALGAGRYDDARALVFHALVIAVALGLVFMIAALAVGPLLYRAMGGEGPSLSAALTYSNVVFIGAIPLWITALLGAALRGAGNVKVPALITLVGAVVLVPLSPALIFGAGPLPRLGVAGGGAAVASYYVVATVLLLIYLRSGRSALRLVLRPLERRHLSAIMGVGALSAIGTVQANLTVALVTGAVGLYGTAAIAGYGIASRLDYLLIPLLFGFGTASVTMVGANVGAGQAERARRIAWTGAVIGGGVTGLIGLAAAVFPDRWTGLFSSDPMVLATGALYLRTVAPFYWLFGAGYMLYFASQGAGRVLWPVIGGTIRLLLAGVLGWLAAHRLGFDLFELFGIVAAASVLFGIVCIAAVRARRWGTRESAAGSVSTAKGLSPLENSSNA
jgi:putative MATE family efflux protein